LPLTLAERGITLALSGERVNPPLKEAFDFIRFLYARGKERITLFHPRARGTLRIMTPETANFFTEDYCAILFALAEVVRSPVQSGSLEDFQRAASISTFCAWLNAEAMRAGVPWLAVGENALSGRIH